MLSWHITPTYGIIGALNEPKANLVRVMLCIIGALNEPKANLVRVMAYFIAEMKGWKYEKT